MLASKPWQIEIFLKLLLRLLLCFGVGMVTFAGLRAALGESAVKDSLLAIGVSMVTTHGAVLVLAWLFVREHSLSWRRAFGLDQQAVSAVALGAAVAVIVLPVMWLVQGLVLGLAKQHGYEFDVQTPIRLLRELHGFWPKFLLGVFAMFIAPVAEELFFRGILYPLVKQHTSRAFAVVTVALFFALMHGNVPVILPLTLLAIVLTLLYEWTGNLLACVTVHAFFNAANFVALFFERELTELLKTTVQ